MIIVSFGYTAEALKAGAKTCTRREWKPEYARRFGPGTRFQAYDKSPRYGGKKIGVYEVVSISQEHIGSMPDTDFEEEGFAWYDAQPSRLPQSGWIREGYEKALLNTYVRFCVFTPMWIVFLAWRRSGRTYWVLRFREAPRG